MTQSVVTWKGMKVEDMTDQELVEVIDELQAGVFEQHDPEAFVCGREYLLAAIDELAECYDGFYEADMVREAPAYRVQIIAGEA